MTRTEIDKRLAAIEAMSAAGASAQECECILSELQALEDELCRPEHARSIIRAHIIKKRGDKWRRRGERLAAAARWQRPERKPKPAPKRKAPANHRSKLIGSNPVMARDVWRQPAEQKESV